jgi:hypothetical protein
MRVNRFTNTPRIVLSPSLQRVVFHSHSPRIINQDADTTPVVTENVIFDGENVIFDGEQVVK